MCVCVCVYVQARICVCVCVRVYFIVRNWSLSHGKFQSLPQGKAIPNSRAGESDSLLLSETELFAVCPLERALYASSKGQSAVRTGLTRQGYCWLVKLEIDIIAFCGVCGATYCWQSDIGTHSAPPGETFVYVLKLLRLIAARIKTARDRKKGAGTHGVRVIAIAATGHLRPSFSIVTLILFRPLRLTFRLLPCSFCYLFSLWGNNWSFLFSSPL